VAGLCEPPGCRVRGPVRYACTAACAGVIVFGSLASQAQIPQPSTLNRTVNLNYVYAAELGFGGYSLDGLTAQVFTLPLDYTLHDVLRDGWALRILAPIQLGLYSLKVTDTNGERISINQQSVAVVPGAELEIPIGSRTVFKPFGQFGVGHTFGVDVGSPNFYVFLAGVRRSRSGTWAPRPSHLAMRSSLPVTARSAPASPNITFRYSWAWNCAIRSASALAHWRPT
jgi:hypothetical protein